MNQTSDISQTNTTAAAAPRESKLVTIEELQESGIFPKKRVPCIRTLRDWTMRGRIPSRKVGGFVFYNVDEVERHMLEKLRLPARQ